VSNIGKYTKERLKRGLMKKFMRNIFVLTIIAICVILTFVGCEFGFPNKDKVILEENENPLAEEPILEQTKETFKYNESGKIIIIMYHRFADVEKDEWTRSFENFYKDLEYLYEKGYRSISLSDYLNNNIKVPVGCSPIIFTFDDGTKGQFNLIKDENGNLVSNPNSAVGIMEKFYNEHPDFGLNGTFYINQTSYFSGEGTKEERLQYLLSKGFEIGNHTDTHINFTNATAEEIQKEIGKAVADVKNITDGYAMTTLALPYGSEPKENKEYLITGEYEGTSYENKAILFVGSGPAYSPNSEKFNSAKLPRVRARGGNSAVKFDLYYWLELMEKNPEMKYTRLEN
jgi:peptidoglycan/xylan/chitin deacetylase (PgdA/CDA1 family)